MDCNPVVVSPHGAVIVDARVRVEAVARPARRRPSEAGYTQRARDRRLRRHGIACGMTTSQGPKKSSAPAGPKASPPVLFRPQPRRRRVGRRQGRQPRRDDACRGPVPAASSSGAAVCGVRRRDRPARALASAPRRPRRGRRGGARRRALRRRRWCASRSCRSWIEKAIEKAYERVCEARRRPVAVRSSATAEDTEAASFAGMNETFLNIKGSEPWPTRCGAAGPRCSARARSSTAPSRASARPTSTSRSSCSADPVDALGRDVHTTPATETDELVIEGSFGLGERRVGQRVAGRYVSRSRR